MAGRVVDRPCAQADEPRIASLIERGSSMAADIFLSYAHEDLDSARSLAEARSSHGHLNFASVWCSARLTLNFRLR